MMEHERDYRPCRSFGRIVLLHRTCRTDSNSSKRFRYRLFHCACLTGSPSMMSESSVLLISPPRFFVVSPKKLAIMTFFTFGLYWWFCFHRSWVSHRHASGERILPLVRALFPIIFLYPLMRRIDGRIRLSGQRYSWSPLLLTLLYIVSTFSMLLLDQGAWQHFFPFATLFLLTSYAVFIGVVVSIQCAINFSEGDVLGLANARLTLVNWIWMVVGLLFWPLLVSLSVIALLM